jgi:uncharacterized protein (TIGR03067 family)
MRRLTFLLLTCLAISCDPPKRINAGSNFLNGTWIPIKQELGGAVLPAAAYQNYKLTINDSVYTYGSSQTDQGVISYDNGKMDIYGKIGPNAGKHYTAIYKLENAELTICYNLTGKDYPGAFDTKGQPLYFLSVFKKESSQ